MSATLYGLPDELLICIVEQLEGDKSTLRQLAQTSRRLQDLSEPILYRTIFFRTSAELSTLLHSIKDVPKRRNGIRNIDARCSFPDARHAKEAGATPFRPLSEVLRLASKTTEITIESPYCNNGIWHAATEEAGWGVTMTSWLSPILSAAPGVLYDSTPQPGPLQMLKKATLHLNGIRREFLPLNGPYAALFAHPTLEELHLSSVNLPSTVTVEHAGRRSRLKRLTLDEANITHEGLRSILRVPEALEYLYIGENRYSPDEEAFPAGQRYNMLPRRDAPALLEALISQGHSLQSLIYRTKLAGHGDAAMARPGTFDPRVDFSGFEKLKEVSFLGDAGWLSSAFTRQRTAPPNLRCLEVDSFAFEEVVRGGVQSDEPVAYVRKVVDALPLLKQIEVVCDVWAFLWAFAEPVSLEAEHAERRAVATAGDFLKQKNITLRVSRPPDRTRFVRPILYGEQEPMDVLVYVNDRQGWRISDPVTGLEDEDDEEVMWEETVYEDSDTTSDDDDNNDDEDSGGDDGWASEVMVEVLLSDGNEDEEDEDQWQDSDAHLDGEHTAEQDGEDIKESDGQARADIIRSERDHGDGQQAFADGP